MLGEGYMQFYSISPKEWSLSKLCWMCLSLSPHSDFEQANTFSNIFNRGENYIFYEKVCQVKGKKTIKIHKKEVKEQ